jgi:hypothetical protein
VKLFWRPVFALSVEGDRCDSRCLKKTRSWCAVLFGRAAPPGLVCSHVPATLVTVDLFAAPQCLLVQLATSCVFVLCSSCCVTVTLCAIVTLCCVELLLFQCYADWWLLVALG